MTDDELADAVIAVVENEPTQPSGLAMRRIVADLFRQTRDAGVAAERERVLRIVRKYGTEYACNSMASDAAEGIEREVTNAEQGRVEADGGQDPA